MSSTKHLNTAVLFLIFNRLDTTKQVFEAIKIAKPPRLYIAADGARLDKSGEMEIVESVRDYVIKNIDWDCEVKTLFQEKNLGCKMAVSSAIDWFFENEEMGIILEDDCLPNQSFFRFCEELLDKYKNDMRIWHISGNDFVSKSENNFDFSYSFGGIYGSIWGWASWKTRWEYYERDMKTYDTNIKKILQNCYDGSDAVKSRIADFESIKNGLDTWDYQWVYTRWINNGLTIVPCVNLVSNLGFGEDATHTHSKTDKRAKLIVNDLEFPLRHPKFMIRNVLYEKEFYKIFIKKAFLKKLKHRLKKLLWAKK